MSLRDAFRPLLADPSPKSWTAICRLLDDSTVTDRQHDIDLKEVAEELKSWPPEIQRLPPQWKKTGGHDGGAPWHDGAHQRELKLCRTVAEKDLYGLFIAAATTAPALRLRDGTPAIRLERQFTGALQGAHGKIHSVGVTGGADLHGSLCVEWQLCGGGCGGGVKHCSHEVRLSVPLEVEIKTDGGKLRPEQAARQGAFRRRGEVSLVCYRTADMLRQLCDERARILKMIGG